jgi:hypothetical protein
MASFNDQPIARRLGDTAIETMSPPAMASAEKWVGVRLFEPHHSD